jgi:starvation-inducible outer membrane lipoprotein
MNNKTILAAAAALALAACHEVPQDAAKPYAGKEDVKPYAGDMFKGDKQKFEQALAERASHENEYLRTHDAKQ